MTQIVSNVSSPFLEFDNITKCDEKNERFDDLNELMNEILGNIVETNSRHIGMIG